MHPDSVMLVDAWWARTFGIGETTVRPHRMLGRSLAVAGHPGFTPWCLQLAVR